VNKLSIFLVDDDELIRSGMEVVINSDPDLLVIGHAENGLFAIEKIQKLKPDIIVMDIQMPVMNGLECIYKIREFHSDIPILILTTFNEINYIVRGLANGANGYLIKDLDFAKITQAIKDLAAGQFLLPTHVATKLSMYLLQKNDQSQNEPASQYQFPSDIFTDKEQEILLLLVTRLPNKEIAEKSYLSEGTLRNYLSKIYSKMNVTSRNEAIKELEKFKVNK
jgi:DNA-binding NarL/FixJ family response regulator